MSSQTTPLPLNVIGPYTPWPRRGSSNRARAIGAAAVVGGVAVFAHCVVPML